MGGRRWRGVSLGLGRGGGCVGMCLLLGGLAMLVLEKKKIVRMIFFFFLGRQRDGPWIANSSIITMPMPRPFSPSARHSISSLPVR